MSRDVCLAGLAYELGDQRPVAELRGASDPVALDLLCANGIRHYRRSEQPAGRLAAASLVKSIALWGGDPRDIDLVLYCSESLGPVEKASIRFGALCRDYGLGDVPVVGVSLSGCANLIPGLRYARALLRAEGLRNVAVVTADTCLDESRRIADWDLAVLSDGAASCIVSTEPSAPGVRLLGVGHAANPRLRDLDRRGQRPRILLMIANGVRRALEAALQDAAVDLAAIGRLVSTNTRRDAMEFFARHVGLGAAAAFTGTLDGVSHCYSSDVLINILASAGAAPGPGPFAALSLGPDSWGALVLQDV